MKNKKLPHRNELPSQLNEVGVIDVDNFREDAYERALHELDAFPTNQGVPVADIADIVGVLADIKPSAFVVSNEQLNGIIANLGLAYYFVDSYMTVIAKTPEQVKDLTDALVDSVPGEENTRKIGELLGYPETAIEYFIKRGQSAAENPQEGPLPIIRPEALTGTMHGDLSHFMLSPEHWREEIEEYILPLDAAMKEMIPKTYHRLERRARIGKIAQRVLGFVGIRKEADGVSALLVK